jgi:hypothetical protein
LGLHFFVGARRNFDDERVVGNGDDSSPRRTLPPDGNGAQRADALAPAVTLFEKDTLARRAWGKVKVAASFECVAEVAALSAHK